MKVEAFKDEPTDFNVLPTESALGPEVNLTSVHSVSAQSSESCEVVAGLSEGHTTSFLCLAPSQKSPGARGETRAPLQGNDCVDVTEWCQSSAGTERKHECKTCPDVFLDNEAGLLSERDVHSSLRTSIFFLSAVVSLCVVVLKPSALFVIGLFLILHHL